MDTAPLHFRSHGFCDALLYNLVRPHSALRDNAPAWFAAHWQDTAARAPATAPERRKKPSSNVLLESLN